MFLNKYVFQCEVVSIAPDPQTGGIYPSINKMMPKSYEHIESSYIYVILLIFTFSSCLFPLL